MTLKILVLGIIQGLTEFFPISSSGHIVLFDDFFKLGAPALSLTIFLHTGTLMAVVAVFHKDLRKIIAGFFTSFPFVKRRSGSGKLAWLIIFANIPAGIAGIFLKEKFEIMFTGTNLTYICLIITGIIIFLSQKKQKSNYSIQDMGFKHACIIGLAQMCAILPGISRSGTTITTAILLGLNREDAAKFSFFIMLPAVGGATLLELIDINNMFISYIDVISGIMSSFIVGFISLKLLIKINKNYKLHYFTYYCIIIGSAGIIYKLLIK